MPGPGTTDEFPDEVLALVCSFLSLKGLGRLACTARRFTQPTFPELDSMLGHSVVLFHLPRGL